MARRRNPGVRILAAAAVVLVHVYALGALLAQRMPIVRIPWDDTPALVMAETYYRDPSPPRTITLEPAVVQPVVRLQPPDVDSSALADPAATDWRLAGERAAAGASIDGPDVREFGAVARPAPRPRKAKPFGWDPTHTQRVAALPEGGIRIRLSARCEMTLAPFPMAGCSLGKIAARGDLFDELSAPAELGDWNDGAATLNGR